MKNKKYNTKSEMKSSIMLTEQSKKVEKKKSFFELNLNEKQALKEYDLDNQQKLFYFISDKNKFCLKSHFDHKGTKAFLIGKNEAMKKIELNENIEENRIKSSKIDKENKKKLSKMKSEGFATKNLKSNKNSIITETSKNNKKKKRNSKSYKFLTNCGKKQLINLKLFNNFDLEGQSKLESPISIHKHNKKKKSVRNKIKNEKEENIEKKNNDKSIISIVRVDSKLFNNKKDNYSYERLLSKDDIQIFQNILYELDVNKKS